MQKSTPTALKKTGTRGYSPLVKTNGGGLLSQMGAQSQPGSGQVSAKNASGHRGSQKQSSGRGQQPSNTGNFGMVLGSKTLTSQASGGAAAAQKHQIGFKSKASGSAPGARN